MKYKIYRLCRNSKTVKRLKKEEKQFNLPQSEYITGIDLFTFINNIINKCPDDYALVVHDDVILPTNISDNVQKCIKSVDDFLGEENWGVIGNAGVEVLTKRVLLYLSDPNIKMIVPSTQHPKLVESVDGNTMLLNLKNIRREKISLPKSLTGFHLYDLILSFEIQRNNLLCAVSSLLYCRHSSGGSRSNFREHLMKKDFQDYFSQNYSNTVITSINGDISVNQQLKNNKKNNIEDIVKNNLTKVFKEKSFKLFFLIELDKQSTKISQLLESIKVFKAQVASQVNIRTVFVISDNSTEEKHRIEKISLQYESLETSTICVKDRQKYFQKLCEGIDPNKDTYISIIKDDYIILTDWCSILQYLLSSSELIVSPNNNAQEVHPVSSFSQDILSGDPDRQYHQMSSMIFNSTLLSKIAEKDFLIPRDLENYIVFLSSINDKEAKIVKTPFYKIPEISLRNQTKLNYEYTTVMAHLVNENLIPQSFFKFFIAREEHWHKLVDQLSFEFNSLRQNFIWKTLEKWRSFKKILRKDSR